MSGKYRSAEPRFAELGVRSNFSFLEGASHPEELAIAAEEMNLTGIGLADRNTVAGTVRMHVAVRVANERRRERAEKQGGVESQEELFYHPGARFDFSDDTPDILAYPIDRPAWGRLCRLLSQGNLRSGVKGTCEIYEADLIEWGKGLLLIVMAEFDRHAKELPDLLRRLETRFPGQVHLALVPFYDGRDRQAFDFFAETAATAGIRLIATNDALMHTPERKSMADVVVAIREHLTVQQAGYRLAAHAERHLKEPREIVRLFRHFPQAIENACRFFERLTFSLDELKYQYPNESLLGETPAETLRRLAYDGANRRYANDVPDKVAKQIEDELELIGERHYEPYFLTVWKIMQYARSKGILCQGRGSAANSTICYCMEITEVNPMEGTRLLFARFISTSRDEPPDIDVDFEHERRDEVINYIYDHYGKNHAGIAAAVISYRTRSAGRETAKAFGLSEDQQSALSGTVWGWSEEALNEREVEAVGLDIRNPVTRQVLDHSTMLMNFPRHLSQHVGGFVITRDRLDEVMPIMPTAMKGRFQVEWNKDDLDELDILKIDILALGMLTCIAKAFKLLENHYGTGPLDIARIMKQQHHNVYDMICRADTIGVFQVESRAQMSMLPRLRPREFYDLVIEVAIVRPGPIQGDMVHPYLRRRQGLEPVIFPKPEIAEILQRTKGVPLFQEQAMEIAILSGFSPAEADKLRRAMATFKRNGMLKDFQKKMVDGLVAKDYPRDFAERCFKQIEGFGEYGFPESHAASFAILVYVSCALKAYYPDVFCAAILNSQPMGFYAPSQLIRDAREHGVEILEPDINHSTWYSDLTDGAFDPQRIHPRHREMEGVIRTRKAVRLGFHRIKGLSEDDAEQLVAVRGEGYRSVRDLWLRSGLPRAAIERLADADAFRSIGLDRRAALWAVRALDEKSAAERLPLFEKSGDDLLEHEAGVSLPVMPDGEHVIHDYKTMSHSLKAHPVSFLRQDFDRMGIVPTAELLKIPNGRQVTIAGLVLVRQRPGSAKGVIFMTLEDETGIANAIVWKNVFDRYRPVVMGSRLVSIRGKLQHANNVIHVVAEHIENLTHHLSKLLLENPPIPTLSPADEVRRPTVDHRQASKEKRENMQKLKEELRLRSEIASDVMPGGRNFH